MLCSRYVPVGAEQNSFWQRKIVVEQLKRRAQISETVRAVLRQIFAKLYEFP